QVTDMLQEMLTTICSLKTTVKDFREELQLLKDNFQKTSLEELQERSVRQEEHSHLLQSIRDEMAKVHGELSSFPWHAAALCWRTLCRAPSGKVRAGSQL
ncbi:hypothetical protein Z169_09098, partial [Egretta garzetta]